MNCNTEIYVHKFSHISIWYTQLAVEADISPGNAIFALFMGPHLPLGALNPHFPRYTLSIFPCKPNKMLLHHLCLSNMSEFFEQCFLLVRIFCGVIKQAPLAPLLVCFSFVTCFEFCLFCKAAFTGLSVRIAVAPFFLVVFAFPFLPIALGKRTYEFGRSGTCLRKYLFQ
jgi:hypothetical protein